ncbi:MAG: ATP-dependent Clp protease ATP-binding subunit [Candidatus Levybacteria bacterium]|nr:ATP-dependent Clp protease ATP-binding subunit [Candidatus Levybacteria bacterium]
MIEYAAIYASYRNITVRLLRVFILIILLWLFLSAFSSGNSAAANWRIPLILLSLFLMFEIFFHFKISKIKPLLTLSQNDGRDIYKSFTLEALEAVVGKEKTLEIIKGFADSLASKFILTKSNIVKKEIPSFDIPKEDLLIYAFNLAKNSNAKFVTTMDIFASYFLITEQQTKLLFSKNLKPEEFLHILYWAKVNFPLEENPKPIRVEFAGEGLGESWVYGWTLETQKYMEDMSWAIMRSKNILVGRDNEYKNVIEGLYKSEKSNVLLVGEVGTGVTSIVKKVAFDSLCGNLPGKLYHRRFFQLFTGSLFAGTSNIGDLEVRLQSVIEEISNSGDITVFVPEFQDLFGASTFQVDLSGAILPYLKNEEIQIIASVHPPGFKKYIEPLKNILDLFEVVKIEEPDQEVVMQMLLADAEIIEKKNRVNLTYKSISKALELSKRYMQDKVLPGCAYNLLNDAANKVYLWGKKSVEEDDVVKVVEEKTNISVAKPKGEEKELLLHLEEKLHERLIDQNEAISAVSEALRRLRSGLTSQDKPISFLFLGPTGVGKTETAKALSSLYFGGEEKMIRLDMSEYTNADSTKRLLGASAGEGDEKGELTEKVYENPFSLVLLDEFEKANSQILDLFLQVLDDGRLTDNKGKTVSFVNTIIIATSNAASEFIREEIEKGSTIDNNFQARLLDFLQEKGIFKPELLNRFDGVIVFKPLGEKDVEEIVKLMIKSVSKKLEEQDIIVSIDEKVISKIAKEGFDKQFGARPLRRFIQDNIEDLLAKKLLNDEIKRGDKILISTDEGNNILITSQTS